MVVLRAMLPAHRLDQSGLPVLYIGRPPEKEVDRHSEGGRHFGEACGTYAIRGQFVLLDLPMRDTDEPRQLPLAQAKRLPLLP